MFHFWELRNRVLFYGSVLHKLRIVSLMKAISNFYASKVSINISKWTHTYVYEQKIINLHDQLNCFSFIIKQVWNYFSGLEPWNVYHKISFCEMKKVLQGHKIVPKVISNDILCCLENLFHTSLSVYKVAQLNFI